MSLSAWASEVEQSKNNNTNGIIEIIQHDSNSNATVTTTISDEGFDYVV